MEALPPVAAPLPVAAAPVTSRQEAVVAGGGGGGRERCPRCASRDTKFCYYNNYNTAQPRHFCRACRRHWTLGGSLRNVPIGGAVRKRHRHPARPTRALAAAVTTTAARSFASPPPPVPAPAPALFGSLPMLAPGAAPLLEGRLGTLGQPGDGEVHGPFGFGAAPLLWPASMILEGDHADSWKAAAASACPSPAGVWPAMELAGATAMVEAGSWLHHVGDPQRL